MSSAVVRVSAALLFVFLFSTPSETQNKKPSEERVWFAVEERPRGQLGIEPFAVVSEGELVRFPSSCTDEYPDTTEKQRAAANYLQPGKVYPVLFGGAESGEVRIVSGRPDSNVAEATYEGPVKIRGKVKALATNLVPEGFRAELRQIATKEERATALELAREVFRQHGIPANFCQRCTRIFSRGQ